MSTKPDHFVDIDVGAKGCSAVGSAHAGQTNCSLPHVVDREVPLHFVRLDYRGEARCGLHLALGPVVAVEDEGFVQVGMGIDETGSRGGCWRRRFRGRLGLRLAARRL